MSGVSTPPQPIVLRTPQAPRPKVDEVLTAVRHGTVEMFFAAASEEDPKIRRPSEFATALENRWQLLPGRSAQEEEKETVRMIQTLLSSGHLEMGHLGDKARRSLRRAADEHRLRLVFRVLVVEELQERVRGHVHAPLQTAARDLVYRLA